MSPSPRTVGLAAILALALLAVPWPLVLLVAVGLVGAVAVDGAAARRPLRVTRTLPARLARGVPSRLTVEVDGVGARSVRVRQPRVPDLRCEPAQAVGPRLEAEIVALRRGRHEVPGVVIRAVGPLGLARWDHPGTAASVVDVDPDLPAARRIATAVRQARFRDPGLRRRGAVGLGTDFDRLREYQPDDDIRHVNWMASARRGQPMTNQYREDTERDVVALVDLGRLMAAPVAVEASSVGRTRLDVAIDAAAALAAVADAVGDRCGAVAFDDEVRARVRPRRASGRDVVRALHALEPRPVESDPERAFRTVGTTKRALVVVLTDLVDAAAAAALLDAVPILVRRHAVVVASCVDRDLDVAAHPLEEDAEDETVLRRVVAETMLAARDRAAAEISRRGARVIEAPPERLAAAAVAAYLDAKAGARI